MKVIDAGAIVELLVGSLDPGSLGDDQLAAPHLVDSEVTHAIRGLTQGGILSQMQGELAMEGFIQLTLTRHPAAALRPRMWVLRHNLTAYDATYVALAEQLNATALLTTDARLARATGPRCRIDLL